MIADIVVVPVVMGYTCMAYVLMAYIVMACIFLRLHRYGLCGHGLHSYGLYSYVLYSYGAARRPPCLATVTSRGPTPSCTHVSTPHRRRTDTAPHRPRIKLARRGQLCRHFSDSQHLLGRTSLNDIGHDYMS